MFSFTLLQSFTVSFSWSALGGTGAVHRQGMKEAMKEASRSSSCGSPRTVEKRSFMFSFTLLQSFTVGSCDLRAAAEITMKA